MCGNFEVVEVVEVVEIVEMACSAKRSEEELKKKRGNNDRTQRYTKPERFF